MSETVPVDPVQQAVRARYGALARGIARRSSTGVCCAPAPSCDPVSRSLYGADELAEVPEAAVAASLGCGNPTALAELAPGEVVLDLGSGGGIDVLLSARRVGPTGFAYGVDFSDEMLALARRNAAERGVTNVEFLEGRIEDVPLPDASVDVVISNCVINLSTDKARVIREAHRVLRPGGRLAVSDIVVQGELPAAVRKDVELWMGCMAGALEEEKYRTLLASAGFADVSVEVARVHDPREAPGEAAAEVEKSGARLVSAFIRARKPSAEPVPSLIGGRDDPA